MSVVDDIKKKANRNDDGKLSKADLDQLRVRYPEYCDKFRALLNKADTNKDGKISLSDIDGMFGGFMENMRRFFHRVG